MTRRRPVPPVAVVLSGATLVAVLVLAAGQLRAHGVDKFFEFGDARLFLLTTRDLFGTGHGFAAQGRVAEIPYRYGRMGLPLLAWLLGAGRPALVGWTLIGVNLVAIAAVPGLAATLLDQRGAPPAAAAVILLVPGFIVLFGNVVADPLLIAVVLLAYVLDARGGRRSVLALLAYAVLVKEVAVLALAPLAWRAARDRDWRSAAMVGSTLAPYTAWVLWLRWRVGEFPFLAHSMSRSGAVGLPFAAIRDVFVYGGHPVFVLAVVLPTIALGALGAWLARGDAIAGLALMFTVMTICIGHETLLFPAEATRVLSVAMVFGLLALVIGLRSERGRSPETPYAEKHGLFVGLPDL